MIRPTPTVVFIAILQHFLDKMKYDVIGVRDHLCTFHSRCLDQVFDSQLNETILLRLTFDM
jgi:hypothetical protein